MASSPIVSELQTGKGYVVIPHVLTPTEVQNLRQQITTLAEQTRTSGKLIEHNKRWRLRLVGQADVLFELTTLPAIRDAAREMLGQDYVLGGLSAHALTPGAPPQGIHVDYPYSVMREPFPETPVQMQAIIALDHFREDNGATRVLPHSQKTRARPDREQFYQHSIPILCEAGSIILSHGGLWHDSGTNRSSETRIAVLANFTPFWIRSIEGFPETARDPNPSHRNLLGFNFREAHMRAVAWKREDKDARKPPY